MSPVLLLLGVAVSDAVGDLWRVVNRGPATAGRLLGRLLGEAAVRMLALCVWVSLTALLAAWRSPSPEVAWAGLWTATAAGLAPLLFAGLGIAPHIGPAVYIGLHGWVVFRLSSRLHTVAGLSVADSVLAVLAGAAGYWLCRAAWPRRRWPDQRPAAVFVGSAT